MEHWHRSGQALLNEISSTRLPASQLAVWSIGQCGFIFKYEDTVVCIDPVLSDLTGPSGSRRCYPAPFAPEALRADLVLCTHGHADHMAKDTLRGLARHPAARFVLPAGCSALAAEYGIPADRITTVQVPSCRWAGSPSGPFPPPTRSTFWMRATPAWRWGISSPSAALRSCTWATPT